jgi:hypothetical protein
VGSWRYATAFDLTSSPPTSLSKCFERNGNWQVAKAIMLAAGQENIPLRDAIKLKDDAAAVYGTPD